ncbi:VCBS domain-containing protein [Limibaculum sp. M0105]|uniref:VCBS domain-containing protein n=1 Tax=Thermohalobaculum xanthum TaxID=2753746 RepID=A0A8J7SG71_9RHOB|nr:VCBS domain-containing protein [Thermohalobaculum xanthum]MBK0400858.1 VCBS domain-containing protein [Thermohalobaculum xanthum]
MPKPTKTVEFEIIGLSDESDEIGGAPDDEITSLTTGFTVDGTLADSVDTVIFLVSLSDGTVDEVEFGDADPSTTLTDEASAAEDDGGSFQSVDSDWRFTLDSSGNWTLEYTGADLPSGVVEIGAQYTTIHPRSGKVQIKDAIAKFFTIAAPSSNAPVVIDTADDAGGVVDDPAAQDSDSITDTGAIAFSDSDLGNVHSASAVFSSTTHSDQLGSLSASVTSQTNDTTGAGGVVIWDYEVTADALRFLGAGEQITEVYTVEITDNNGSTVSVDVTVTLDGTNDAPTISVASSTLAGGVSERADGAVDEGTATLATSGAIAFDDADGNATHGASFVGQEPGYLGTFSLASTPLGGTWGWSFEIDDALLESLPEGQTLTQRYDVTIDDRNGGTATETVTVTLTGANDAAVIGSPGDPGNDDAVTEDETASTLTATGVLAISDADTGEDTFSTTVAPVGAPLGTLVLAADGSYTYSVANAAVQHLADGATHVDRFTVTSDDGTTREVAFTVTGTNDVAVISGTDSGSVTEDTSLNTGGVLSVSDSDDGEAALQAVSDVAGSYGSFTVAADGTWSYALNNANAAVQALDAGDAPLTDSFEVTSADGSATHMLTVTINGVDEAEPPTDPDQTVPLVGTPDLLAISDTGTSDGDDITGTAIASFSVALISGVEAGDTVTLQIDGSDVASHVVDATDIANGAVTFSGVDLGAPGAKSVRAAVSDGSGNTSVSGALVATLDAAAAGGSTLDLLAGSDSGLSDSDNLTNVTLPVLRVYFDAGVAAGEYLGFYINGTEDTLIHILEQSDIDQGYVDLQIGTSLADGVHSIEARIGTVNALYAMFGIIIWESYDTTSNLAIEIDTTAPDPVTIVQALAGGLPIDYAATTDDTTPEFTGTAAPGTTVTLRQGTTVYGATTADASGNWSITPDAPLPDKLYYFFAETSDEAGNIARDNFLLRVDAVADPAPPPPQDEPSLDDMWHLAALGGVQADWTDFSAIESVWADYSGANVSYGIFDDGVEYDHVDLDDNYDWDKHLLINGEPLDAYPAVSTAGVHGTAVSGVIAAEANGEGTVGIAYGATLTGVNIFSGPAYVNDAGTDAGHGFYQAIDQQFRFDIVNHSWGGAPIFLDDDPSVVGSNVGPATVAGFEKAVETGRGGLGTLIFKSAGNWADNANGNVSDASRYSITVAAFDSDGDVSFYSNRGSNVLISAPSSGYTSIGNLRVPTTDRQGLNGYVSGDWSTSGPGGFGGTSSASPTAAGVAGLMLEANPDLGWRDVQDILAYSASHIGSPVGVDDTTIEIVPVDLDNNGSYETTAARRIEYFAKVWNGADNWNGGGLHYSNDYGFGAINVHDAVRMAEVWHLFGPAQTSANEGEITHSFANADPATSPLLSVSGDGSTMTTTFTVSGASMELDTVDIRITLAAMLLQEAELTITSPSGTEVTLTRPDIADYMPVFTAFGTPTTNVLAWTYGAHAFKGEDPNGVWTVTLTERDVTYDVDNFGQELDGIALRDIAFTFYGTIDGADGISLADDVYHYTDEVFDVLAATLSRDVISDASGTDWLDMAAMTHDLVVDLAAGTASSLSAGTFIAAGAEAIENVVAGDGDDTLIGTAGDNQLIGMRGSDTLNGGGGTDSLTGGVGSDLFVFETGFGTVTVTDFIGDLFAAPGEADLLDFSGVTELASYSDFTSSLFVNAEGVVYDHDADGIDTVLFAGLGSTADISEDDVLGNWALV